jgi:hypothetical protein
MRPPFDRLIAHTYDSFAGLPATGDAEALYIVKEAGEKFLYYWTGTEYLPYTGGGHAILNEDGEELPQRKRLKFTGNELVDDETNDVTIVQPPDFDRPHRPQILSPVDSLSGVPILTRIKATEYAHPYNVPIKGSRWQIATNPDFTALALDREQLTAASSTVVTTDSVSGLPILDTDTPYYVRVLYMDIRERDSKWSEPVEFTTASALESDVILQPDIISPVNEGWVPEKKLIVQLTQPEAIGVAVPDAMDLQVSITPDFDALDIVQDYVDYADPRLLVDDTVDFSAAPSPLYLRARQKDSVRSLASQWSSVPTVWLQRAFSDLVVGLEMFISDTSFARNIDEAGNVVGVNAEYWNDHPVWGGMVPQTWTSRHATPLDNAMVRIPRCYVKADTLNDNGKISHRFWLSPVPRDGFVLHPAFVRSTGDLLISACLLSADAVQTTLFRSQFDVSAARTSYAGWLPRIDAINGNDLVKTAVPYNAHYRALIMLLMIIEYSTMNIREISPGKDIYNNSASYIYRGLRSLFAHDDGNAEVTGSGAGLSQGFRMVDSGEIYLPDPVSPSTSILMGTIDGGANYSGNVSDIMQGYSEVLGVNKELYLIPAAHVADTPNTKYYNRFNTPYSYVDNAIAEAKDTLGVPGVRVWGSNRGNELSARFAVLN